MSQLTEYEEEVEQVAEEVQELTGFSSTLSKHLVFVGEYISWYTNDQDGPQKENFREFNDELTELIDETAKDGVELGDISLVLWTHMCNIEKLHRKDNDDGDSSDNRTADRMFQ
jgi:hypothetical protein